MTRRETNLIYFLAGVVGVIMLPLAIDAFAGKYTEVNNITNLTITEGVSDQDLARGIAASFASGGHQFDFSTTDWQGSEWMRETIIESAIKGILSG